MLRVPQHDSFQCDEFICHPEALEGRHRRAQILDTAEMILRKQCLIKF